MRSEKPPGRWCRAFLVAELGQAGFSHSAFYGVVASLLGWSLSTLLVSGFFAFVALIVWRRMPSHVAVHTHGLVIRRGGTPKFVPWSEILEIVAGTYDRRLSAVGAQSISVLFENAPPPPLRHADGMLIVECTKKTRPAALDLASTAPDRGARTRQGRVYPA